MNWIKVTDGLPHPKQRVLCCGPMGGMFVGRLVGTRYEAETTGRVTGRTCGKSYDATHWMPLPELPEEDE